MKALLMFASCAVIWGCGVKGDPMPPVTPAELGRGQPTYKKATEEFAYPDLPPIYKDDKADEKESK